jgi:hypothetical protein
LSAFKEFNPAAEGSSTLLQPGGTGTDFYLPNAGSVGSQAASTASTAPVGITDRFAEIFKPSASGQFTFKDTLSDIGAFVGPGPKEGTFVQRYGVPATLAALALSEEEEVMEEGVPDFYDDRSGADLFAANPQRYGFGYGSYNNNPGTLGIPGMASGGQTYPRRTGRISGPGTETSDDIPAMLSDGEFVMTAQAVRGAGNGSRKQGMRKMYDMMRRYESAA